MSEELVPAGEILLYQTDDGRTRLECRFQDQTIWLSQALMAELFAVDVRTVNEHLQNIYSENELPAGATIRKFRIVRREGTREVAREIEHYNLDAILAVGYRVALSNKATKAPDRMSRRITFQRSRIFIADARGSEHSGNPNADFANYRRHRFFCDNPCNLRLNCALPALIRVASSR